MTAERRINLETVVDWMAERGEFGYVNRIQKLRESHRWDDPNLDTRINEIRQEAMDRYNDWVSDPL